MVTGPAGERDPMTVEEAAKDPNLKFEPEWLGGWGDASHQRASNRAPLRSPVSDEVAHRRQTGSHSFGAVRRDGSKVGGCEASPRAFPRRSVGTREERFNAAGKPARYTVEPLDPEPRTLNREF